MNLGNLKVSITDDEINDLPLKYFEGDIIVIENRKELKRHIDFLCIHSVLGFDTETKPAFRKGVKNEISLLQLSVDGKAFLFRLNKMGFPKELINILTNPSIIKVGLALKDDVKGLQRLGKFIPNGFLDLQDYVKFFHIEHFGLRKLAALLLDVRISKSQRLTNWDTDILSEKQQIYAATDAWVTLEIYKKLKLIELNINS